MGELELSMLARQCLDRCSLRAVSQAAISEASVPRSPTQRSSITWQFTIDDSRRKLHRLYPS